MNTVEIKNSFHKLIDEIDNEIILSKFYNLLERASLSEEGSLWEKLSSDEKEELLKIDEESKSNDNLISFQSIKDKHKKWLK